MCVDETEIGFQCVRLTPALRDQLQIRLNSVENLAALDLPSEGRQCVAAYFSPSWTAFQADRGRDFSVIVDGVSG